MRKTQRYLDVEMALRPDLREPFQDIVRDYRARYRHHLPSNPNPQAHYDILSDLLRMGWRKTAKPDAEFDVHDFSDEI